MKKIEEPKQNWFSQKNLLDESNMA